VRRVTPRRIDTQATGLSAIEAERDRQEEEFGVQKHDAAYWYAILGKQFGQLGEVVVQHKWAGPVTKKMVAEKMYGEATQVAAVALALMEAIRMDELQDEITTAQPRDPRQRMKAMGLGHEAINYEDAPLPPFRGDDE
jgi:hypothetical protein